jgi:hypothetical protein
MPRAGVFLFADIAPAFHERFGFVALPRRFQERAGSACMPRSRDPRRAWGEANFAPPPYF